MAEENIFSTVLFGGYSKDEVSEYVRKLEGEKETIRLLSSRKNKELAAQAKEAERQSEELRTSLAQISSDMDAQRRSFTKRFDGPAGRAGRPGGGGHASERGGKGVPGPGDQPVGDRASSLRPAGERAE